MDDTILSRIGTRMHPVRLEKIIEVLTNPENDGLTQDGIASLCGISKRTLRNYLTPSVWDEIRIRRLRIMAQSLSLVDKAVFTKAVKGDIAAAKLIYSRWDDANTSNSSGNNFNMMDDLPDNMEEIDNELTMLKGHITALSNTKEGES